MSQTKQLANLIDALRKDPDSRLLVAGGKPSIFSEEIRNLERVTIWSSTEHSPKLCNADIPVRTKAIVFNKWIDHRLTANLRRESQRKGVPLWNHPLTPSTIVDLIKEAGLMPNDTDASVISDAPTVMGRGQLRQFIQQEADLRAPVATEIPRLWALAQERGLPTTEASISTTFYSVRAAEVGIIRMKKKADGTFGVAAIDSFPPVPEPFIKPADAVLQPNDLATVFGLKRAVRHAEEELKEAFEEVLAAEAEAAASDSDMPEPSILGGGRALVPEPTVSPTIVRPTAKPTMEPRQVLALIDDAIVNLQKLTGDAVSALQLVHEAIESIEPALRESAKLQAKIEKMRAFLDE